MLETQIQNKAFELGYEKCGIIPIQMMEGYQEKFEERIQKVPMSKPFYQSQKRLLQIREDFPWAKSVIILAAAYGKYKIPEEVRGRVAKAYLFDNRMNPRAPEHQYSLQMEQYLLSLGLQISTNRKFGIVGLRWAAMQAGIGVVRRNNFFYTESGSWVHLEAFLTDHEMELLDTPNVPMCPKGCDKCIAACPTKALAEPYTMQPVSCISFLTTFGGRDMLNMPLRAAFGRCIYGCDLCQEACPMNQDKWQEREEFPGLAELAPLLTPENILQMTEKVYRERVQPLFFYLTSEELWKWKVDALCYMRNNNPAVHAQAIAQACGDEHPKVREMAHLICEEFASILVNQAHEGFMG